MVGRMGDQSVVIRAEKGKVRMLVDDDVTGLFHVENRKAVSCSPLDALLYAERLANKASSRVALVAFDSASVQAAQSSIWMLVIVYSYALRLYFDFSGYSDIARGLAKWMGLHFRLNFNHPYHSKSLREFWTRWHISLSTWFRDYLYFPLGGNRVKSPDSTRLSIRSFALSEAAFIATIRAACSQATFSTTPWYTSDSM